MKDVYLKKDGGTVKAFYSIEDMKAAGFSQADTIVSDEEFNSNGCYARIIGGEIVVGKTAQEVADEERVEQIIALKSSLAEIDHMIGAGRSLRAVAILVVQAAGLTLPEINDCTIEAGDDDLTRLCKCEFHAELLRNQLKMLEASEEEHV